jgi:hypothetical protein
VRRPSQIYLLGMTTLFVATHDPPPKGVPNPIHSDAGATSSGYAGSLVAGVRLYGWTVAELEAASGGRWLDEGWVDFSLRRPVFVDDTVTIEATNGVFSATTARGAVLEGIYGEGEAPFLRHLRPPPVGPGREPPVIRPTYDLDNAPLEEPLIPLTVRVSGAAAQRLASDDLGIESTPWRDRVHPFFLAGRMAPLTRHNFSYGSTIHVRSQIQHLGKPTTDQAFTVGARIVEVYDRKGHWYQVLDGVVSDEAGCEVARIRHHTIFRPRPPSDNGQRQKHRPAADDSAP